MGRIICIMIGEYGLMSNRYLICSYHQTYLHNIRVIDFLRRQFRYQQLERAEALTRTSGIVMIHNGCLRDIPAQWRPYEHSNHSISGRAKRRLECIWSPFCLCEWASRIQSFRNISQPLYIYSPSAQIIIARTDRMSKTWDAWFVAFISRTKMIICWLKNQSSQTSLCNDWHEVN